MVHKAGGGEGERSGIGSEIACVVSIIIVVRPGLVSKEKNRSCVERGWLY